MARGKTRERTFYYRRASWLDYVSPRTIGPVTGGGYNLQSALAEAHRRFKKAERIFSYEALHIQGLKWREEKREDEFLLLHLASYEPGGPTSLVPNPDIEIYNTEPREPPQNRDYLDSDSMILVRNNDLILCPSGAREFLATYYIGEMYSKHRGGLLPKVKIGRVADFNAVKLIQKEGIKKLRLKASALEATVSYAKRKAPRKTLMKKLTDDLLSVILKEPALEDLKALENLSVRLELSFDTRKKGGELAREQMTDFAAAVMREESSEQGSDEAGQSLKRQDDFEIVTTSGKKLTSKSMVVHKSRVPVLARGKSVDRDDAWHKMIGYYEELEKKGVTER